MYYNCDPEDLEWPKRGHKIVKELLDTRPDIICLQEVQNDHLQTLYRPRLNKNGFNCLFKAKTGVKVDGCAIFYRRNLFRLHQYKPVEFNRVDLSDILNRDNVGHIAVLKPRLTRLTDSLLVVANTHLLFNPNRTDIRLAQIKLLLSELEFMSFTNDSDGIKIQHPTILCGDLNSNPDSQVVNFIMNKTSPSQANSHQTNNDEDAKPCEYLQNLRHPFDFKSAYQFKHKSDQAFVTTFANSIVDYIFYTPNLQLETFRELLTEEEMRDVIPIPNSEFPSDHLSLTAQFSIR